MMIALQNIRDFLDEQTLKFLPGNLQVESCMLLTRHVKDPDGVTRMKLLVFDHRGSLIGEIPEPYFVPSGK